MEDFYSMEDFYKVDKIDAHIHLNSAKTELFEIALENKFKLIAIKTDVPFFPSLSKQQEFIDLAYRQYKEGVYFLTTFSLENWGSENWLGQTLENLKVDFANGALGVKVWKNIGMSLKNSDNQFIMIDDDHFNPVVKYIIQQNKVILGHLGEPKNCWLPLQNMTVKNDQEYFKEHPEFHMYLHPEYPSYDAQIEARDNLLQKNPKLQFIGAHLGSLEWSIDELSKHLENYPNMAVDVADRICHFQYQSKRNRDLVRDFFIKYQDRIIYATDFIVDSSIDTNVKDIWKQTWINDWKYFATNEFMTDEKVDGIFQGLQLPKKVINKLYFNNAIKWYKIEI
jgi:predicted TIM-barrel fold metal-dependent hydrolase